MGQQTPLAFYDIKGLYTSCDLLCVPIQGGEDPVAISHPVQGIMGQRIRLGVYRLAQKQGLLTAEMRTSRRSPLAIVQNGQQSLSCEEIFQDGAKSNRSRWQALNLKSKAQGFLRFTTLTVHPPGHHTEEKSPPFWSGFSLCQSWGSPAGPLPGLGPGTWLALSLQSHLSPLRDKTGQLSALIPGDKLICLTFPSCSPAFAQVRLLLSLSCWVLNLV